MEVLEVAEHLVHDEIEVPFISWVEVPVARLGAPAEDVEFVERRPAQVVLRLGVLVRGDAAHLAYLAGICAARYASVAIMATPLTNSPIAPSSMMSMRVHPSRGSVSR